MQIHRPPPTTRALFMQGSKYTTEIKAQAVAIATGSTAAQAARELQLPYRTVARWIQTYAAQPGNEEWADANRQVISRSTELTLDGLDQLEERGEAYKNLIALNAIRGTAIDKQSKYSGGTVNIIALVTSKAAELQSAIEGEYRELSAASTESQQRTELPPTANEDEKPGD